MKSLSKVLFLSFLITGITFAGSTSGFAFLDIPVSARAVAMGGAFTAMTDDANALYWNPAGIASIDEPVITTSYSNYLMDMQAGFLGWVNPRENDVIGVSLNYFYGGSFIRTTLSEPQGTGDEFSSNNIAIAGSYSKMIFPMFSAGITGRFVYSTIDTYSGTAALLDFGTIYQPGFFEDLTLGLAIRNVGLQTKAFYQENDPMPTEIGLGATCKLLNGSLLASADFIYPFQSDIDFALGVEYSPIESLALRAGGNLHDKDASEAADGGFTDAMSFGLGTKWQQFGVDYAFKPFADLGNIHRISLEMIL